MANDFGKFLKTLIINNGSSQKNFAKNVGLTQAALSQIITGKTRPRQMTLTKIMEVLALTKAQEQQLIRLYEKHSSLPEDKSAPSDPLRIYQENRERVYRFLEIKARSIAFTREVKNFLDAKKLAYVADFTKDCISCDFYLPEKNIGIECKFNAMRDIEKTMTAMKIIKERLGLSEIILAVPIKSEFPDYIFENFGHLGLEISSIHELSKFIKVR